MNTQSSEEFRQLISGYAIAPIFDEVLAFCHDATALQAFIVFGSFAYGSPTSSSDLDAALLFSTEIDNRAVRAEVTERLTGLNLKKKLSIFAYSLDTFAKLYRWNNSIAHGIMGGTLIYCPGEQDVFLNWLTALRSEVPLNIRRYE